MSKRLDANDFARRHGPEGLRMEFDQARRERRQANGHDAAEPLPNRKVQPFPSLSLLEINATKLADPLRRAEGLIGEGDYLTLIFGPSMAGKTFLAISLAFALLRGQAWFGRKTLKCGVLYIAREGEAGFSNRLKAYQKHFGIDGNDLPFRAITAPVNLGPSDDDSHVEKIIATIADMNEHGDAVGMVIYDNMRAVAPGLQENHAEDIEAFFTKTRTIARATGASPTILDNTGKDTERGARGNQAKFDLADTVVGVEQQWWSARKVRDGGLSPACGFDLSVVDLGTVTGIDGEPKTITSAAVVPSDAEIARKAKPVKKSKAEQAHDVLLNTLVDFGQPAPNRRTMPTARPVTTVKRFRERLRAAAIIDLEGDEPGQWRDVKNAMQAKGTLRIDGDYCWSPA